jgi:hypothetical protein
MPFDAGSACLFSASGLTVGRTGAFADLLTSPETRTFSSLMAVVVIRGVGRYMEVVQRPRSQELTAFFEDKVRTVRRRRLSSYNLRQSSYKLMTMELGGEGKMRRVFTV